MLFVRNAQFVFVLLLALVFGQVVAAQATAEKRKGRYEESRQREER